MLPGFRFLAIALIVLGQFTAAHAGSITSIVSFGDSLNDTGNLSLATSGAYPASPPNFNGRYSNGPIWLDQFAAGRGLAAPTPSLVGGSNFAFGGSSSGTGTTSDLPNLLLQIGIFETTLGTTPADPNALYVIWTGGNDYVFGGQSDPSVVPNNISAAVQSLASVGATQFMVMNLPPLGDTPNAITNLTTGQRIAFNGLIDANNQLLKQDLNALASSLGLTIYQPDIHGLFLKIQANPSSYGFTNITTGAVIDENPDPTGYLFWDSVHPTSAAGTLIAGVALASVPEPSTGVLCSVAAVFILMKARRRPCKQR